MTPQLLPLEAGWESALCDIPERYRRGLVEYAQHGIEPGHFLCSVIERDFACITRCDNDLTLAELKAIVVWLFNYAPGPCWGSRERRLAYQESQGVASYKQAVRDVEDFAHARDPKWREHCTAGSGGHRFFEVLLANHRKCSRCGVFTVRL